MNQLLQKIELTIVLAVCALAGCSRVEPTTTATNVSTGTVSFEFVIEDKTIEAKAEDVADGETLESVMRELDGVNIDISGSGTTAYVNQINGLSPSGDKGWTFEIDGEWADKGVGSLELHPPTTVRWQYGVFDPSRKD